MKKSLLLFLFLIIHSFGFAQANTFPYVREWATFNPQGYYTNYFNETVSKNGNTIVSSNRNIPFISIDSLLPINPNESGHLLLGIINPSGNYILVKPFGGPDSLNASSSVTKIRTNELNQIYFAGRTFNPSGTLGTAGTHQPTFSNNVYQDTVYFNDEPILTAPHIATEGFIVKFDAEGNQLWGTYISGNKDVDVSTFFERNGFLYVTGATNSQLSISTPNTYQTQYQTQTSNTCFLMKFDATTGQRIWGTYLGAMGCYSNVTVDSNDNIYLKNSTNTGFVKLNSQGQFVSEIILEDGFNIASSPLIDDSDNFYVQVRDVGSESHGTTGTYKPIKTTDVEMLLIKDNNAFVKQWATYYNDIDGSAGNGPGEPINFIGENKGSVLITFQVQEPNLATPNSFQTNYNGNVDLLFLSLSTFNGQLNWASYYGGLATEYYSSIRADEFENIYLIGASNGTDTVITENAEFIAEDFGIINEYYYRFFIAKFAKTDTANTNEFATSNFVIFPNPVTSDLNIQSKQTFTTNAFFEVYDQLGKKVYEQKSLDANLNTLNLEHLNTGLYFLKVTNGNQDQVFKILKK